MKPPPKPPDLRLLIIYEFPDTEKSFLRANLFPTEQSTPATATIHYSLFIIHYFQRVLIT